MGRGLVLEWHPPTPHWVSGACLARSVVQPGIAKASQLAGGACSHLSSPAPPAFPSAPARVGEMFGPASFKVPNYVQWLQVLCELAGQGRVATCGPAALRRCLQCTCGEKEEAPDGGGCVGTAAPSTVPLSMALASRQLLATTARLNSALRCSLPLGHCCWAAQAMAVPEPALPQRNPWDMAWLSLGQRPSGLAVSTPAVPVSHHLPLPPDPSLTWWHSCRCRSTSLGLEQVFASCFSGIFGVLRWTSAMATQGRCCLMMEPLSWE